MPDEHLANSRVTPNPGQNISGNDPGGRGSEDIVSLLARIAKDWLTFERLRQELQNLGASDPLLVSVTDRDVEKVVRALLSPTRSAEDVEKTRYALLRALSSNPEIARLRFQADEDDGAVDSQASQSMLKARNDFFAHWADFQEGMQKVGSTVCQVFIDDNFSGSGFLISDRHVLTAHHCIALLVDAIGAQKENSAQRLNVVFDNIIVPGDSSGVFRSTFKAAKNWLVFDSKQDDREDKSVTPLDDLQEGRLDFAVICLDEPAGRTAPKQQRSTPRSWIDIQNLAIPPEPEAQMLIAHFPGGADLRLSVGLFNEHSKCSRRIRYMTPTVLGSSGAPCFTVDWKPYALHNAGYPKAHVNQGVPLSLIVEAIGGLESLKHAQQSKQGLLPAITPTGEPILSRQVIAEHVDAIINGESAEVALIVTSIPQGGKTYTAELIRSMLIDFGHAAFLLDAEKFAADSPENFARRLVNEIAGGDGGESQPSSPDSRQRARWISRNLSEWTRSRVSQESPTVNKVLPENKKTLWVILDRCDVVKFSQETHDLLVALIADEELDKNQPLRFLLLGYEGDLGAVPIGRVWRYRLELISVAGVVPFMQYVVTSLSDREELEDVRSGATNWVGAVTDFGITNIPDVIKGLQGWAESRRKKALSAEAPKTQGLT